MIFYRKKRASSSIDLSPLIDVVLSLVIFFILSTSFIQRHGMKLDLPKSKTGDVSEETRIVVTVDKDNQIFVEKNKVEENELKAILQDKLKSAEDKRVLLKADSKLRYGNMVKIMDIVRDSGAQGLTIATQREE